MIQIKNNANLLDATTEALVNTVNCVGVMGKGIALQFKQAFPENFKMYKKACDQGKVPSSICGASPTRAAAPFCMPTPTAR